MLLKQESRGKVAAKKYSELGKEEFYARNAQREAKWAVSLLLKNGYALMDGYNINEILKAIRSLRELKVEYAMKTIHTNKHMESGSLYYEFTTVFFEDDRK